MQAIGYNRVHRVKELLHTHTVFIFIANSRVLPLRAGEEVPETAVDTVLRLQDLWRPFKTQKIINLYVHTDLQWMLRGSLGSYILESVRIGWKWKSPFY